MTANVRFVTPNLADTATLTVSPAAAATLPVTNLQNQTRSSVWRSTSCAQQTINLNFAAPEDPTAVILYRHNLSAMASVNVSLYSGVDATGGLVYSSGAVLVGATSASRFFVEWCSYSFSPGGTVRSVRLVINEPICTDGYMQASRLIVGDYFEPSINMSRGLQLSWQTASKQYRTDGGSLRTDRHEPYRRWAFKLALMTETERAELFEIVRLVGMDQDFFVSGFPEVGSASERDYAGLVKITQMPSFVYMQADIEPSKFETDLVMEES